MDATYIIKKPHITEKSMADVKQGKFTFIVAKDANKDEIRRTIENQFKVNVIKIVTTVQKGKTKRVGVRRAEKSLTAVKKAIVTLKSGQKIDMFDLGV